jgi:hypothetical protein
MPDVDLTVTSPPPGFKFCACGCKHLLPAAGKFVYVRGHRKAQLQEAQARKLTPAQANDAGLAAVIAGLRKEVNRRELRQKYLESEVGANLQRLKTLRQSLEALEIVERSSAVEGTL